MIIITTSIATTHTRLERMRSNRVAREARRYIWRACLPVILDHYHPMANRPYILRVGGLPT